jgi:hypothetical protein
MAMTIIVPPALEERLETAGIGPDEAKHLVLEALRELVENAEVRAWWEGLTSAQRAGGESELEE